MTTTWPRVIGRLLIGGVALTLGAASCSRGEHVLGDFVSNESAPGPTLVDPPDPDADGEGGGYLEEPPHVLACMGTDCPWPYADCSKSPSSFRCQANLMNDPANCGACGVSCQGFGGINMNASCIQGKCVFECMTKIGPKLDEQVFRDCNGVLDDGCEVNVNTDPKHCGACGNECAPGVRCITGKCGCPLGRIDCGRCVDPRFDNSNCGACGNVCPPTNCSPSPIPFGAQFGCGMGECGKLRCKTGYADCNHDLYKGCASDGCEVYVVTDPKNCGGCGLECQPDQDCRDDGDGPQCLDKCSKGGRTQCWNGCKNLLSDPKNCGACNHVCPDPGANQVASCRKGNCAVECLPGFADCNGDPSDGCEVDLSRHPANCGACGHRCDFGAGQPCIAGKCLMVECDGGVETPK